MSEKTLRRLLERLNSDEEFRESLKNERDWARVIRELDLSPAELAAISTQDEDALRRLAGTEAMIAGQNLGFFTTDLMCSLFCFCFPWITYIDTPQSRRHCGTGADGCEPAPVKAVRLLPRTKGEPPSAPPQGDHDEW
jgi:hypothetical protein